jgi:hypothetical protein
VSLRTLFLDMDGVLEAMDSSGDTPQFFLDTRTGQIEVVLEPEGGEGEGEGVARIPRCPPGDEREHLERFVATTDGGQVQEALRHALASEEPARHLRAALAGHPDLRVRWETEKQQRLLAAAVAWLQGLGIDPRYELRRVPPVQPAGRPRIPPGQARIGLWEMLLLGAPEGKTELIDGQVRRRLVAAHPEQARRVFLRVARELSEHHGVAWDRAAVELRNEHQVEGAHLSVNGRVVELVVAVSAAVWEAFSGADS